MGRDLFGGALFHEFAMFKNRDLIADVLHDSKIVGDKRYVRLNFSCRSIRRFTI